MEVIAFWIYDISQMEVRSGDEGRTSDRTTLAFHHIMMKQSKDNRVCRWFTFMHDAGKEHNTSRTHFHAEAEYFRCLADTQLFHSVC